MATCLVSQPGPVKTTSSPARMDVVYLEAGAAIGRTTVVTSLMKYRAVSFKNILKLTLKCHGVEINTTICSLSVMLNW